MQRTLLHPSRRLQSLQTTAAQTAVAAPDTLTALKFLTNPDAWAQDESAETVLSKETLQIEGDVIFSRSKKKAAWNESVSSLLELAENSGLDPAFSCRAGICNTCTCKLLEGEVEYIEEPLEKPDQGEILICCTRPKGRVVLDI